MDCDLKVQVEVLFSKLGTNLTPAVNIFSVKSLSEERIPFEISLNQPSKETVAAKLEVERIANDPSVKGYTELDQQLDDLKKCKKRN